MKSVQNRSRGPWYWQSYLLIVITRVFVAVADGDCLSLTPTVKDHTPKLVDGR